MTENNAPRNFKMVRCLNTKPKTHSHISSDRCLAFIFILVFIFQLSTWAHCNPIAFSPSALPLIAIPPGAYHPSAFQGAQNAFLMAGGQFDPYASMQMPYFVPASSYSSPWASPSSGADAGRRSIAGALGGSGLGESSRAQRSSVGHRDRSRHNDEPTDEQKALDGLPLSLIEPDPPSSISERISESFSALGEGVKNHFRSMTENFSDTMDDIRDAWRPAPSGGDSSGERKRS